MIKSYQDIVGWFDFEDIYAQAIAEAKEGAVFVEVGCCYGRYTAFMAQGIKDSGKAVAFYAVDPWGNTLTTPTQDPATSEHYDTFVANMTALGLLGDVHVKRTFSVLAAADFDDASLDFVMLDGDHQYPAISADIQAWLPKLKPGGVLAGHDFVQPKLWPGVAIAVNDNLPRLRVETRNTSFWFRKELPQWGDWTVPLSLPAVADPEFAQPDYLIYIPYVNRPDLLNTAVGSVGEHEGRIVIIDQSEAGLVDMWQGRVAIYRMRKRPSFSQMQNWVRDLATDLGVRYLCFMHNDAECLHGAATVLLAHARQLDDGTRGVLFSNYDAFAVFILPALRAAGYWDETFPWYVSDVDYYHRVRLSGLEIVTSDRAHVLHHVSQTLRDYEKKNAAMARETSAEFAQAMAHYVHKWGGRNGHEVYTLPYNNKL